MKATSIDGMLLAPVSGTDGRQSRQKQLAKTAPYTRAKTASPSPRRTVPPGVASARPAATAVALRAAAAAVAESSRRRRSGRAVGESSPSYVGRARRHHDDRCAGWRSRGSSYDEPRLERRHQDVVPRARSLDSESPRCRYDDDLGSAAAGAGARAGAGSGAASIPSSQRGSGDRRQSSARRWYDCSRRRSSSWRSKSRRRAAPASPPGHRGLLALVLEALVLLALARRLFFEFAALLLARGAPPLNLALVRRVLLFAAARPPRAPRPKPPRPRPPAARTRAAAPPAPRAASGLPFPAPRPRGAAAPRPPRGPSSIRPRPPAPAAPPGARTPDVSPRPRLFFWRRPPRSTFLPPYAVPRPALMLLDAFHPPRAAAPRPAADPLPAFYDRPPGPPRASSPPVVRPPFFDPRLVDASSLYPRPRPPSATSTWASPVPAAATSRSRGSWWTRAAPRARRPPRAPGRPRGRRRPTAPAAAHTAALWMTRPRHFFETTTACRPSSRAAARVRGLRPILQNQTPAAGGPAPSSSRAAAGSSCPSRAVAATSS